MFSNQQGINRRSFLTGSVVAGAGLVAGGTAGRVARASEDATLHQAWDREADIVIVGFGGAGAAAAATACSEGLGDIIVLEAAPDGADGGNTRVAGELMFIPEDADKAIAYQSALNAQYEVEEDLMRAWADAIVENLDWVTSMGGDMQEMALFSPEFPELEGSDTCRTYCVDGQFGQPCLWNLLKSKQEEYGYEVMYETRATRLVFDPASKMVYGVRAQTADGGEVCIKARKGVILSCGGFENDPEMMMTYAEIGRYSLKPLGTTYNRGDGFRMIAPLGAKLWHMNNMAGNGLDYIHAVGYDSPVLGKLAMPTKGFIWVAGDAKRFMYEEEHSLNRHGKVKRNGVFVSNPTPNPSWCVFDQTCFEAGGISKIVADNQELVDAGVIFRADTVEELAEKIGLNPASLAETVAHYNECCANGVDDEFGRGEAVYDGFNMDKNIDQSVTQEEEGDPAIAAFDLVALETAPYYAVELVPKILNTQGGPKRGVGGEVLDIDENPIPRLYAAGEFGTIYSYMYNGGGNVSEAIATGRLAARSVGALEPWE